jgi:holo-[acyl-carrier protein] synthase
VSRILGLGSDLVNVDRFAARLKSPAFRRRVFTAEEIDSADCSRNPVASYAMKFAAKEAVMKCLGAGIRQGLWFSQIEILDEASAAPVVTLRRRARELSEEQGAACWTLVLCAGGSHMLALAICQISGLPPANWRGADATD